MEARTELRGTGISKLFVGAFLVIVAVGLGVMAAVVAKNLSAPAAAPSHFVQGQGGAAQANPAYRGGAQVVDGNAATAPQAVGPDDRAGQLAPAYQQVDTRGVTGGISGSLQVDTRGIIPAEAFPSDTLSVTGAGSFLGPDAQERNLQLAAGMRTAEPHGYI
jgi:hypothetical protein